VRRGAAAGSIPRMQSARSTSLGEQPRLRRASSSDANCCSGQPSATPSARLVTGQYQISEGLNFDTRTWRNRTNRGKRIRGFRSGKLKLTVIITFRVSRRRREMYSGYVRLCVCLSVCVCLSLAAFPHYCTNSDITWGMVGVPSRCALLGGFAIGARVSLL